MNDIPIGKQLYDQMQWKLFHGLCEHIEHQLEGGRSVQLQNLHGQLRMQLYVQISRQLGEQLHMQICEQLQKEFDHE
jgi:hypothetical protein